METALRPAALSLFDRKSFYTLLTATGAGLIALAGAILVLMGALHGDLVEQGVFGLILIVPGLLASFLVWRFGRWAFIVALLACGGLLAMFAPFLPFSLSHPESGSEFVLIEVFTAGALLAVIGAVAGLIQWRRKSARPGATAAQRTAYVALLSLVAALAVLSMVLAVLATTSVPAEAKAGATPLAAHDFSFGPDRVEVAAGQTVRLVVKNTDPSLHTFTLPEAGIDIAIPAGAERLIEFTAPAAGSYTWYCIPHSQAGATGRQGMVGTLVVEP